MKWFGMPVAAVMAMVDGRLTEVATIYEWANGDRRIGWIDRKAKVARGRKDEDPRAGPA